jgi:hypothetical protein
MKFRKMLILTLAITLFCLPINKSAFAAEESPELSGFEQAVEKAYDDYIDYIFNSRKECVSCAGQILSDFLQDAAATVYHADVKNSSIAQNLKATLEGFRADGLQELIGLQSRYFNDTALVEIDFEGTLNELALSWIKNGLDIQETENIIDKYLVAGSKKMDRSRLLTEKTIQKIMTELRKAAAIYSNN